MVKYREIKIDLDVHKRIEAARQTFDESDNDVLRRLLEITKNHAVNGAGRPWAGKGVALPQGTEARMEYNGRMHTARIEDGMWFAEGKRFGSPSAAAGGVALTKEGRHPKLDGWRYWQVRRPGDVQWRQLDRLRRDVSTMRR